MKRSGITAPRFLYIAPRLERGFGKYMAFRKNGKPIMGKKKSALTKVNGQTATFSGIQAKGRVSHGYSERVNAAGIVPYSNCWLSLAV